MTCIMVTHNPDLECYADRVLYIEDGQVCGRDVSPQALSIILARHVFRGWLFLP
jgi:putative ABC transport system ATP-binding protein